MLEAAFHDPLWHRALSAAGLVDVIRVFFLRWEYRAERFSGLSVEFGLPGFRHANVKTDCWLPSQTGLFP